MLQVLSDCFAIFSRALDPQECATGGKIGVVRNRAKDHIVRYAGDGLSLDSFSVFFVVRVDGRSGSAVFQRPEGLDAVQRLFVVCCSMRLSRKLTARSRSECLGNARAQLSQTRSLPSCMIISRISVSLASQVAFIERDL
jgi:hypothetical protein